jgi:hypothetical protein
LNKKNKPSSSDKKILAPRPSEAEIQESRAQKRQKERELRKAKESSGRSKEIKGAIPNRKSAYQTTEEERQDRSNTVIEQVQIMRAQFPDLLANLSKIKDPRNPKTIHHQTTVLLIYGILTFVFQCTSRREANREMTTAQFYENIQTLFPEIESLPHNDTLKRFLEKIDVREIEAAHIAMVNKLIRNKKFQKYLINNCYPIAIDGTQKFTSNELWDVSFQQRTVKKGDSHVLQYYVYVVEANLVFHNGMSIPLLSEFLDYQEGDTDLQKQDCERLTERLKKYFPKLRILLLLDGLYANGPIIEQAENLKMQYMIVLKDGSLPSVWEDANGLIKLLPKNQHTQIWGDREQHFWWANEIDYYYGKNEKNKLTVNVVVCENGQRVTKKSKHAWISSRPLKKENLHERCNLAARHRWGIELSILKEKKQGYQYEHCFSKNWNAMMGYHYLMRIAHFLNELVHFSKSLAKKVLEKTVRGFIGFIFETCKNPWFNLEITAEILKRPYHYQLA